MFGDDKYFEMQFKEKVLFLIDNFYLFEVLHLIEITLLDFVFVLILRGGWSESKDLIDRILDIYFSINFTEHLLDIQLTPVSFWIVRSIKNDN